MKKLLFVAGMAALIAACSQKTSMTVAPTTAIDVERLGDSLDYAMDISTLSLGDVRLLAAAPAARRGFPFKDAYLRAIYQTTTWYDSLMWKFDESVDFSSVKERNDETWRDYYYRAADEVKALNYTDEEQQFIDRLQKREQELLKLNFQASEGGRVNIANLTNPAQITEFDPALADQLARDGFAVVAAESEQLFHIYEQNDYNQFPSFVTTDLFLQLYHLYFDAMLRDIEEHTLDSIAKDFARDMYINLHARSMAGQTATERETAHRAAIFFSVACELLTGRPKGSPDEQATARQETERVMKAVDNTSTFIGEYNDVPFPYSLFRPRGHYSRSERLQRYFRGMMWLQSVPFGLDNPAQLKLAVLLADELNRHELVERTYERMNRVLTLLMGEPDNLSLTQVQAELKRMGTTAERLLDDNDALGRLKKALEDIAGKQTRLRPKYEYTSHTKVCVMPQRYQPDAEVLLEMVDYDSEPTRRGTPKGLDVMAAMGVGAAERLLAEESRQWQGFKPALEKMKERMGAIDWQLTAATQWMQALTAVCSRGDSVPYFMATPEWELKSLNAALGSWAELKHDAILYAKQPMGAECGGGGVPDPVVKGYVEPNTAFWQKAAQLTENTARLLKEQGMMTPNVELASTRIAEEARFLLRISGKELAGEMPTDEEMDQLKCIGATFENISLDLVREPDQYLMGWDDVQGTDRKVALVADVYTANADNNPEKSILYEAVGLADEIYVVVEMGGYLYLTRGAVLSYREFTVPMGGQRLTDEEWQQQLEKNPRKGVPAWMERITVPLKQKPQVNEELFYSSGC